MRGVPVDPRAIERLGAMIRDGATSGAAAEAMGWTRSAVIGMARRRGFAFQTPGAAAVAARAAGEFWDAERKAELVRLAGLGWSARRIAAEWGRHESGISKKGCDLGVIWRKPRPAAKPHGVPRPKAARVVTGSPRPSAVPRMPADIDAPEPRRVTLLDLRMRGDCHWPLWPHGAGAGHADFGFFCGLATGDGRSYCPHHAARAVAQ